MTRRFGGEDERDLTVLHVAPTPFFSDRGGHVRIRGLVSALNKRGVRNIVCTYHHGRDVPDVQTRRISSIPGYTKQEAGPSAFKYLADPLLFAKALAVAWKEKPDIIHGHLHEGALIGWIVKIALARNEMPLVFDVQGSLVGELEAHGYFENRPGLKQLFWGVERLITWMPDAFICSSGASARVLRSEFGVDANRLTVVHDGVDVDQISSGRTEAVRGRLGIPRDVPVIVYTGALLPAKGVETLKGMILAARKREVPVHFLIVGYPEEEMEAFVRRHGLHEICTVTGRVPYDELSDYLGVATLAIDPKEPEAGEASGKILNYMGAGLPVVCFDTDKNRNLLGEAGAFVRARTAEAFVEQVETLVKEPSRCARKGTVARERAQERFSWEASAEQVEAIYAAQLHGTGEGRVRDRRRMDREHMPSGAGRGEREPTRWNRVAGGRETGD